MNYKLIRVIQYRGTITKKVHYTDKGISELWKPGMTEEENKKAEEIKKKGEKWLIQNGYVAITPFSEIKKTIS